MRFSEYFKRTQKKIRTTVVFPEKFRQRPLIINTPTKITFPYGTGVMKLISKTGYFGKRKILYVNLRKCLYIEQVELRAKEIKTEQVSGF